MATQSQRISKSTTELLCSWCGEPIPIGSLFVERYGIVTPEDDGAREIYEYGCYYHMECDTALIRYGNGPYTGDHERGGQKHKAGEAQISASNAKDVVITERVGECCYWHWGYVRRSA